VLGCRYRALFEPHHLGAFPTYFSHSDDSTLGVEISLVDGEQVEASRAEHVGCLDAFFPAVPFAFDDLTLYTS
jgi:hypothetical protein